MDDVRLDHPLTNLTNGVVLLRPWRLDDLDCVKEASDEGRIPQGTTVPAEFTVEAGEAFVRRQWERVADGRAVSPGLPVAPRRNARTPPSLTQLVALGERDT
jgi:hypothetical protein